MVYHTFFLIDVLCLTTQLHAFDREYSYSEILSVVLKKDRSGIDSFV